MTVYLIPDDTKIPMIQTGLSVEDCRTETRQSIDWGKDTWYRECKLPLGTGFTKRLGMAVKADP
jgi:hypothetical protein